MNPPELNTVTCMVGSRGGEGRGSGGGGGVRSGQVPGGGGGGEPLVGLHCRPSRSVQLPVGDRPGEPGSEGVDCLVRRLPAEREDQGD